MRFGIRTLDEYNVKGKTVLCRVDINQPVDRETGALKSVARIRACVPTLRELSDRGAKLVVLAHQGSDIEYNNFYTTKPHAEALVSLLGQEVRFVEDVCGPTAREAVGALGEGEILLLDNVRFCSEEQTLFEQALRLSHEQQAKTQVVMKLAPLLDLYVCDAFAAAHRDQPSLCGFEQLLPSAMGRLFEKEYCVLSEILENPDRPCVFVLGGSKIADAFLMMGRLLGSAVADSVLCGGLVAQILLAARGDGIGQGSLDFIRRSNLEGHIAQAEDILAKHANRIMLPETLAWVEAGERREGRSGEIPAEACVLDIGASAAAVYADVIRKAKTVFVNGPMGVFEQPLTEAGTRIVWDALGDTQAYTVVGGGDSIVATAKYGKTEKINYLCTGGGSLIRFLAGEELPVVRALRYAAEVFPYDA